MNVSIPHWIVCHSCPSTPVGYYNIPLAQGAKMTGASFKLIADEGMKLTQLKVDGYQTSTQLNKLKATCGMRGKITLTILANDGSVATDDNGDSRVYEWWETFDWTSKTWNNDGCWKQIKAGTRTQITDANDVTFNVGDGFWVQVITGYVAGKTVLCHNGEALMASRSIELSQGAKGVIAPVAKAVKLTSIKIDGYQTSTQLNKLKATCGMRGKITLTILANDGSVATDDNGDSRVYEWWETFDWTNKKWNNDGKWQQIKSGTRTPITDANDVTFEMGEGLWIQVITGYVKDLTVAESRALTTKRFAGCVARGRTPV